jgi:putative transposase
MCRVLEVSTSGYYAWSTRGLSHRKLADQHLGDRIEALHRQSRCTYGRPRIQADLRDQGICVSDKRTARLMRERRLRGACRRKAFKTTIRDKGAAAASDLVKTMAGFLFLAVVLNVFSRRVVGWAMATHMRADLVVDALDMALFRRRPKSVIHHSDHGSQYTSIALETAPRI